MLRSFSTGLSGLRTNQLYLDIIGNNLANVNTIGYRGDRASFSDLFNQMVRPSSAPGTGIGGLNPLQVGSGTQVGSVDKVFTQGNLQNTGRTLDLGISGDGFFRLSDGNQSFYTRAGAFGLDSAESLVDLATGLKVMSASGSEIQINGDQVSAGKVTGMMELAGNLPGKVTGPIAEVLTTSQTLNIGTAAEMAGTLDGWNVNLGDEISILVDDSTSLTVALTTGAGALADVITDINAASNAAGLGDIATDDGAGHLVLTSPTIGNSSSINVANVSGDALETMGFTPNSTVFGTETPATAATEINDLVTNVADYVAGETIEITGIDADGSAVSAVFTYAAGDTVQTLVDAINTEFANSTVTFENGNIIVTADTKGDANMTLSLNDTVGNTGSTLWGDHPFAVSIDGKGPDTVTTSLEVFDLNGQAHAVTLTFERVEEGLWNLSASIPEGEGTVIDGIVEGITFNDDGTFAAVTGTGIADGKLEFRFEGIASSQVIDLDFGSPGTFEGLTQFGDTSTAHLKSQDGYPPGTLASIFIDPDGTIQGAFSNGQLLAIDQIGLTTFSNPGGLIRNGSNLFAISSNSGEPISTGAPGQIVSGVLEVSNVDTAQEFVNLILAQRGFQVNSRVITTSDNILQELLTIVR